MIALARLDVIDDVGEHVAQFLIGASFFRAADPQRDIGVIDNGSKRLVDFVRDGCRQFAHGRQACDLRKLQVRLVQIFLGQPAVFNICASAKPFNYAAIRVRNRLPAADKRL